MDIVLHPIGVLHSPYREKFIVPRQPGLVSSITAELELLPPYHQPETVRELEQFSHLWLLFQFHQTATQGWQPTVRPPRLGGNTRVGVYASRSPFRPNPIGLSVVELDEVRCDGPVPILIVRGADLIDGTPIVDIKPYIPYSDAIPDARGGFASQPPPRTMLVHFGDQALQQIAADHSRYPDLQQQISELLSADPRPAYRQTQEDNREYGALLHDYNIRWKVAGQRVFVTGIDPVEDPD